MILSARSRYILSALQSEVGVYHPRHWLLGLLLKLLPTGWGPRGRVWIYRAFRVPIGLGTLINGAIAFGPTDSTSYRLTIGTRCFINAHVYIDSGAPVTIGNGVAIGHHVVIITTDHEIGAPNYRAGEIKYKPVIIEDGVWIAAGVTLLPGVVIGTGAVVASGAVVTRNVLPNTLVGGVPARVIRILTE